MRYQPEVHPDAGEASGISRYPSIVFVRTPVRPLSGVDDYLANLHHSCADTSEPSLERLRRLIEEGQVTSQADAVRLLGTSRQRVSQLVLAHSLLPRRVYRQRVQVTCQRCGDSKDDESVGGRQTQDWVLWLLPSRGRDWHRPPIPRPERLAWPSLLNLLRYSYQLASQPSPRQRGIVE
jgi:hypothetical protein